ncbi:MAG: DUF4255 domain-containing protein [Saprospiraceae bacterium]|jgi:hypothetical protein
MLHNIIPVIADQLNDYLKSEYNLTGERVAVSSLVDIKGNPVSEIENKVVVFVLNIEEEKSVRNGHFQSNPGMNPPVSVNLFLMFAANFTGENYLEALKFISSVISFFQGRNVFDHQNTPLLSANVDKITAEMVNIDLKELSNLWANLGAKYVPSVVYKLRMLNFNSFMEKEEVPTLLGLKGNVNLNKMIGEAIEAASEIDATNKE